MQPESPAEKCRESPALLRAMEDRADLANAIAAEREVLKKGTISLADLKRDLEL
jgi:hypothetical protein